MNLLIKDMMECLNGTDMCFHDITLERNIIIINEGSIYITMLLKRNGNWNVTITGVIIEKMKFENIPGDFALTILGKI